jgi:ribonucleoside-diphosphate reductase alpha chain
MKISTTQQQQSEEEQTIITPIKSVNESESVEERLTDNAVHGILPARYLQKNEAGETTETVEGMFTRVARNVAAGEPNEVEEEKWADEFYKQMSELRWMPNSPTLMNAGTDMNQLSACFVLEPEDDMEDIFENAKDAALIFQSGGGVGYAFSHLRPRGGFINSTGGEASGPVSFMRVFDETCNQVKQGGKRRGAQMGILRVDHPDIGRFVTAKRDEGELSNFNISVGYTDEFIDAVESGGDYTLYDPTSDYEAAYKVRETTAKFYNAEYKNNPADAYDDGEGAIVTANIWRDYADEISTTDGKSLSEKWEGEIELEVGADMTLPAEFLWDVMIDGAWQNGEPGLFHLDETNREHSFDGEEYPRHLINATNPCAEQPLSEYEACNLGHINLSLILEKDAGVFEDYSGEVNEYLSEVVNFGDLDRTIEAGTRFLDNVVTQSDFPIQEIEDRVSNQRKIGLGIMGFAEMLFQMGIPYGSEDSYQVARWIMRYIDRRGTEVSHQLAKDRGNFGAWDESKYSDPLRYEDWFERHTGLPAEDYPDGFEIRNHNITTIAPCGTTSMIGNTTGGCEPAYNVANFKNVSEDIQGDDLLVEFNDYFLRTLESNGIDAAEVKSEAETLMRNNEFDGVDDLSIPEEIAEVFVTTQDLSSEQHGLMQRSFQEFCDSGISKTVNLPNEATRSDVGDVYRLALNEDELGAVIKGLTVYRDGSRNEQVLTTRVENSLEDDDVNEEAVDLYVDGEISEEAALRLGVDVSDDGSVTCPECGDGELEDTEDCSVCPECWYSPCK